MVSFETAYHGSDGGTPRGIRVKGLEDIFPKPRYAAFWRLIEELGHVSRRGEKIPALRRRTSAIDSKCLRKSPKDSCSWPLGG